MTIIVNTFKDIPRNAVRADKQINGTWLVYLPGDTLPAVINLPDPTLTHIETALNYAKLKALMAMSPAQVQTWVDANVTNISQVQDAIKTLAIAVSILARRL